MSIQDEEKWENTAHEAERKEKIQLNKNVNNYEKVLRLGSE